MSVAKDLYFVAVKLFLEDTDGNLLLIKDKFGDWDLPGGRLRSDDFSLPLEKVVERKIVEELGLDVKYILGDPLVHMRHERNEILTDGSREVRRIFAVGYQAKYLGGQIALGNSHEKYEWVNLKNFQPEKYLAGGWLQGAKDYLTRR